MATRLLAALTFTVCLIADATAAPSTAVIATPPQPAWTALAPDQKQILSPLAGDWDKMENYRRKKWLGIAKRYPTMKPEEQQRIQERMREWAALPPEVRQEAREKFKEYNKLSPEAKAALRQRWQEYQQQKAAQPAPETSTTTDDKR